MKDFKDELKKLPEQPGVYLMKDKNNNIIYIGKAKILKKRVSQYFRRAKNSSAKTICMVSHVEKFDHIVTGSELEAFILECNLIKKYKPKYNVMLKDDKSYVQIELTLSDPYPGIYNTRRGQNKGSKYYGPYINSTAAYEIVYIIRKIFKVRSCTAKLPNDIGKGRACLYHYIGQCTAPCEGKISQEEYYKTFEHISVFLDGNFQQVIDNLQSEMTHCAKQLEFERAAKIRDRIEKIMNIDKIQTKLPVEQIRFVQTQKTSVLEKLMKLLKLPKIPNRIEAYDISNIAGAQNVGVCVVYLNAEPAKSDYCKFNIDNFGGDDYASMKEMIYRRINNFYKINKERKFTSLPDLILLDGGRGHVSSVSGVIESLGETIPIFGLVKDDKHKTRALVDQKQEYSINDEELFKFLSSIQSEVHRFAINTYRRRHEATIKSELEEIKSIGKVKRIKLLTHFGNIEAIKKATEPELAKVINEYSAKKVFHHFHSELDQ